MTLDTRIPLGAKKLDLQSIWTGVIVSRLLHLLQLLAFCVGADAIHHHRVTYYSLFCPITASSAMSTLGTSKRNI